MDLAVGTHCVTTVTAYVADEADVVVAGAGTAGCVAAIAAARNGADVLLVERYGYLGGMMTSGNAGLTKYIVHEKNQADYREIIEQLSSDPASVQVVGGIPMEITRRLIDSGGGIATNGHAGSYVFTSQADFKYLLLDMMEEAGVRLLLHSLIVDVEMDEESICGIVVESKSGRQIILGRTFIDATGDGDVGALAGAPCVVGVGPGDLAADSGTPLGTTHPMGIMFRMGNIDMERCFEYLYDHPEQFIPQPFALMGLREAYDSFKKGDMM
jgi:NADPH-dependent 2,4-dienoyl-CoA reductase/sulfur reductase-like enzyme